MQELKEKIFKLKQQFQLAQKDESQTRQTIELILRQTLNPTSRYLKNFYFKNKKLWLESQNKSAASELLFKRDEILKAVKEKLGLEEVIIR